MSIEMGEPACRFAGFAGVELVQLALGEGSLVLAAEAAQDDAEDEKRYADREERFATGEPLQEIAIHRLRLRA